MIAYANKSWNLPPPPGVYPAVRPLAGLVAAFLCAWYFCPVPPRHPFSSPALIAAGVRFTGLVALAALLPQLARVPFSTLVRSVAASIWFAPLAILAFQGSPWAALPLVILVSLATPLFGLHRQPPPPSADPKLLRQFPSSMIAAVVVQFAAVEALLHHALVAGLLLSIGAALLAWRATAIDPQARPRPARTGVMIFFAFMLGLFGMLPFEAVPAQAGGSENGASGGDDADRRGAGDGVSVADSYRGIILLPERQPHVTLVPPLPALSRSPFRENHKELQIPFFGVYWFFRSPDARPPKDSVEMRGTPAELTFRSHDRRALMMEAHQNLGTPFPVACCSSVQLSITNRNRAPGSIAIELILVNTFDALKPFQSLGVLPVQSVFRDDGPGVSEVLEYPIPGATKLVQFDEFTIRFHRPYLDARESANVAIDGFTLKPR